MRPKALTLFVGALLPMFLCTAWAQTPYTPLPLGSIQGVTVLPQCPAGFYAGSTCYSATISCPNTLDLGLTYGVAGTGSSGTIVIIGGDDGTIPEGKEFISDYLNNGFQTVQLTWQTAWEDTANGSGNDVKAAACRPATFLKYVREKIYTEGGMCAQGQSAGAGALGYALAEYNGGSYLDNVELISGPVFGDIARGCVVPKAPVVTVCPEGQLGCQTGKFPEDVGSWPDLPQYIETCLNEIRRWTSDNTCNGNSPTSNSSDLKWKRMSIVDGLSDSTFSYPQTAMGGWLCSNTSIHCNGHACQNNSAAEGQFFFEQITNAAQPFSVTRIDQCYGQEGVTDGFLPPPNNTERGLAAIEADMIANCRSRH